MTLLEIQTRLVEIVAELDTNAQHTAAIRKMVTDLVKEMGEPEVKAV